MPISRNEFGKGRTQDTIEGRIEGLLKTNRNKAYTENEIGNYLFRKARNFGEALLKGLAIGLVVKPHLDELIKKGQIEAREVETKFGKKVYYAWKSLGKAINILFAKRG